MMRKMKEWAKKVIACGLTASLLITNSGVHAFAGQMAGRNAYIYSDIEGSVDWETPAVPTESTTEAESEEPTIEVTADATTEEVADVATDATTEEVADVATDTTTEETADVATDTTTEETADVATDATTDSSTEETTDEEIADTYTPESDDSDQTDLAYETSTDENGNKTYILHNTDDFVNLSQSDASTYRNAKITIAPTSTINLSGSDFKGFGSKDYPFAGIIDFAGSYTEYIILDSPLFNYLSQDAHLSPSSVLRIQVNNDTQSPVLAQNYVKGSETDPHDITLSLASVSTGSVSEANLNYSSFGGIIGTVCKGASASLNVNNTIPKTWTKVQGIGDRGLFCNAMETGASLTVSGYTGAADYKVESTDSSAGGIVGAMGEGAELTVTPSINFTGVVTGKNNAGGLVGTASGGTIKVNDNLEMEIGSSVTTTDEEGNAGGVIGNCTDTVIAVTPGKKLSIRAGIAAGSSGAAGGLVGYCKITKDYEPDLAGVDIDTVNITSGMYAGGLFGVLWNNSNSEQPSEIVLKNSNSKGIKSGNSAENHYGGLIGKYDADSMSASLLLENLTVDSGHSKKTKSYSGVIAQVNGYSYIKVDDLTVKVDQGAEKGDFFGGIVACSSGTSDAKASLFLDAGTVTISNKSTNKVNNNSSSGSGSLVGYVDDGVVRLSGKTDLSGIKPHDTDTARGYSQLVGDRNNVLVYGVGTGSDYNETTKTGWTLVRNNSGLAFNDIGNWGEVLRVDGTKLKETRTATENDTANLLYFDTTNHTVTVNGLHDYTDDVLGVDIYNPQNFAAVALSYQCDGANEDGALRFAKKIELSAILSLKADIDLAGTGITGFQRDNYIAKEFTGTLNGGGHTITLGIGEAYGLVDKNSCSQENAGCGQIYEHNRIGLFAKTGAATISNLTVAGNIYFGMTKVTDNVYCGGITAYQMVSSVEFNTVTSDVDISYNGNSDKTARVGGFVAYAESGAQLTFDGCSWTGSVTNECNSGSYNIGGYVGTMGNAKDGGKITLKNSFIGTLKDKAKIDVKNNVNDSKVGGILASTENAKKEHKEKISITVTNFTVDGMDISSKAKKTTGGFLGYEWKNVEFSVDGLVVKNSSISASDAGFGGLVYCSSGHWTLDGQGVQYGTGVTFTGKSEDSYPSALLVCRGDDYNNDDLALYLQVNSKDAYVIHSSVSVNVVSGKYFDELVGTTMGDNGNGIVSIATDSTITTDSTINRNDCNTYKKQLSADYNNPKTRYYYNLDSYKNKKSDATIDSGEELVMWSAFNHAESNIKSYFGEAPKNGVTTIQGTIDLQGLSYYPVDLYDSLTLDGANITFDYDPINSNESDNKTLNNSKKQHYMMQMGLLNNVISTGGNTAKLTVKNSTLAGSVGQTEAGQSGALVVGNIEGSVINNIAHVSSISIQGLTLDGIYVTSSSSTSYDEDDTYAPLLINSASSNASFVIKDVTTSGKYVDNSITHAATSLLGNIGGKTAKNLNVTFENMKLDARKSAGEPAVQLYGTKQSIFTRATFIESFMYDSQDTSSSGSYTFKESDTVKRSGDAWTGNVTYGHEISNTENGRNPGQQYYYLGSTEYVGDAMLNVSSQGSTDDTCFASGSYLRYVAVEEGNNSELHRHEIDINIQKPSFLEGCGTYDDPYIIGTAAQLTAIGGFISNGNSTGWEVNLPYTVVNGKTSMSSHDKEATKDGKVVGHYKYTSGTTWQTEDAEDKSLGADDVRAYMRNAYYQITDDITLPENFYGLGGADPTKDTFSGVIIGKKSDGSIPTVKVTAKKNTKTFGGLIAFSQGSVVKDLILDFSDCSLTIDAQLPSQERKMQSFFGGVIGYVVGGDNIIDNVTINGLSANQITVGGTSEADKNITNIGGYVGLIGGNLQSGGGVIFRNITNNGIIDYNNEANNVAEADEDIAAGDNTDKEVYFYRNPFVGRVLDGYACSEDCELNNTDKNYKIHKLVKETGDNNYLEVDNNTISIYSPQQLWVLSAIVNSGAGGAKLYNKILSYNNDAYRYGRSRTGSYDSVGSALVETDPENHDNKYWGGELEGHVSYLVAKYASPDGQVSKEAAQLTNSKKHRVVFHSDCDMSGYGNGFRGIGTTYQDNNDANIKDRTLRIGDNIQGNSNNKVIKFKRNIYEYASEGKDGWWTQGIGLFPVVCFEKKTTVSNLTITGESCIHYKEDRTEHTLDYIGETSAGGFAGMTAKGSGGYEVTFSAVKLNNLTVKGSKYSGGFFGVIGQSSRTKEGESNVTTISSTVGNYEFESCGYDSITIEGGYSAGGFVGTYKNTKKTMKISGTTELKAGTIGWTRDACLEMYLVLQQNDDGKRAAKENGYSGGGGIVGYYYGGDMTVGDSKEDKQRLTMDRLYIYGPQFAYNCDYGLGGVIGLHAGGSDSGKMTISNTKIENSVIEVKIDPAYQGKHKYDPSYYTTPACGLVKGYSRAETTCNNIEISHCAVLNSGFCGGIFGNQAETLELNNTTINDLVVYSQGTGSYSGSSKVGGIMGSALKVDVTTLKMQNVTVISDGNTGLIEGMIRGDEDKTISYANILASNCVVATTQKPSKKYFVGKNTDPGSDEKPLETDNIAGSAGVFAGATKHNTDKKIGYAPLRAFNTAIDNLLLGYYCNKDSGKLSYKYEWDEKNNLQFKFMSTKVKEEPKEIDLNCDVIGVYNSDDNGTPYSKIEFSDNDQYTDGYLGVITGGQTDDAKGYIRVVGLSMQGGYYPYELNGNSDVTFAKRDDKGNLTGNYNGSNYVIFADYSEKSFGKDKNTVGVPGRTSTDYSENKKSVNSPYVVVNASSSLEVYSSKTGNAGMLLTSDGMNDTVKSAIVEDLSGDTPTGKYAPRYNRVTYKDNDTNTYKSIANKFNKTSGVYKDRVTTFFDAGESKKEDYGSLENFDVLMIDTTDSKDITNMVYDYISVLTNCEQASPYEIGSDSEKQRLKGQFTSLDAYTYKWNTTANRFVKEKDASLVINSDKTISVKPSAHDNQNKQFTVLDVFYVNPRSSSEGYHLFIPVVVKKVLQTEFSIKMRTGSSDYAAAYEDADGAMLANYGDRFTAQLTYSYIWTEKEWNDNIANGTNFLWGYDKQVSLGNEKKSLGEANARYTLVDMNRRYGKTFFTGDGNTLEPGDAAVLKFDKLAGYNTDKTYLSDILPLVETEKTDGTLKILQTSDEATIPDGATIRRWNGERFVYYAPKDGKEPAGTKFYTLTVDPKKADPVKNEVKVSEVYYLTINCQEDMGVVTQMATLGLEKMVSSDSNALPSKMKTTPGEKTYTIGKFYQINNASILPEGEDKTTSIKVEANDYIDLSLSADVIVQEKDRENFTNFANDVPTFFRFAIKMHNDGTSGTDRILAGRRDVLEVRIGDVILEAQDYQCELANGVLYLVIRNKRGADFIGKKVSAKLQIGYDGDAERIDAQFPLQSETDKRGIFFSVDATIAYGESSLDGSSMNATASNSTKFYREKVSTAELTYNAYDRMSVDENGNETGNVSQLGINGKEAAKLLNTGVWISTKGMYDASQLSTLNTTDTGSSDYPNYLVGTLKLQKKTGDTVKWKYEDVNMSEYFERISLNSNDYETPKEDYQFRIKLTDEQRNNLDHQPIEFDIAFFVKSDSKLEALTGDGQYANYKVVLSAHLEHVDEGADASSGIEIVPGVSDYIIYTHAKIFDRIISTRDFDNANQTDGQ